MVVHNFDPAQPLNGPKETDTVLVVDTDTVLAGSLSRERLKPIPGRHAQIREGTCRVKLLQLPGRNPPKRLWATPPAAFVSRPLKISSVPELSNSRITNA